MSRRYFLSQAPRLAQNVFFKEEGLEMNEEIITLHIKELREMQQTRGKPERSILETAMFLEDVFGIYLEDAELDEAHLGSEANLEALTSLVVQKLSCPEDSLADGMSGNEKSEA